MQVDMINPTITYEITKTTEYPDGGKLVSLTLTRSEQLETSEGTKTTTYVRGTTLYVKPGEDQQERIDAFIAENPI
jgi:hypothetical protein